MEKMREKLDDILLLIDWSEIAEQYFERSPNWIYQRMSEYNVNGKPAQFTEEQKEKLREALRDVIRRIDAAIEKI